MPANLTTTTLVKFHSTPNMVESSSGSGERSSKYVKRSINKYLVPGGGGGPTSPSSGHSLCASKTISDYSGGGGRPPFITTVTRGKFLPSKFDLMMVEKSLFTFSSRPRPIGLVTKHQCSLTGRHLKEHNVNCIPPRGAHDYYNMMYDPHIFRGRATTSTALPSKNKLGDNNGNENKSMLNDNGASAEPKTRRKRASTLYDGSGSNNNNGRSNNNNHYKITTRVTTRTSKGLIKLVDRQHTHVQTEQFLEDLDCDASPEERDAVVQTDAIHDFDCTSSNQTKKNAKDGALAIPLKNGVDAGTQVLPGELFSFDEEVQPMVETLVGKIIQQSLLETMEEEEIGALREQQNRFLEKRKHEEKLLKQLQEDQQRIQEEKERLKLQLNENSDYNLPNNISGQQHPQDPLLSIQDRAILDQAIRSASKNQPNVPTSYLIELIPSVLNSLRQEGYLSENVGDGDIFSNFLPVWQSSSKAESEVGEPFITRENSGGSASADREDAIKPNSASSPQPEPDDDNGAENDDDSDFRAQENSSTLTNATTTTTNPEDDLLDQASSTPDSVQNNQNEVEISSSNDTPPVTANIQLPSFERTDVTAI